MVSLSTFFNIGATNHSKNQRVDFDYYATDPIAGKLLLEVEPDLNNIYIKIGWVKSTKDNNSKTIQYNYCKFIWVFKTSKSWLGLLIVRYLLDNLRRR